MAYRLTHAAFDDYLKELSETYRIIGPMKMYGKGKFSDTDVVGYGEVAKLDDLILDEKSYYSPKEVFYPIRETLFYFAQDQIVTPEIDLKPILLFARACDINGIHRLDEIFLRNGDLADMYYQRRRDLLKFAMIECTDGFDSCFCVSMDANTTDDYDMAIRFEDDAIHLKLVDESLLASSLDGADAVRFEPDFVQENTTKVSVPAVEDVTLDIFDDDVWKEYTRRCIACGRCNTSCITCSCFTMQDVHTQTNQKVGERRRRWAGCHVDGFTDMAGGHGFRDKNGERMRFKTMHKINDFYRRFDYHMCVGCGRCDDVCPEYISFSKCINKVNEIIERRASND